MRHADKLETLPTDRLVPYARNARTHSPEQVAAVARSIQRFGFTNPVLIDAADGIVAGHGRVLAAKSLGMASVPCLRVGWLTEAEKRAYVLADNKLAELAGWDDDLLAGELHDLREGGFDLSVIGFADDEIDELLHVPTKGNTDPDDVPPPKPPPIVQRGEIWVLGKHRLMCGDSTDAENVALLMAGKRADVCLTDPPYGLEGHATAKNDYDQFRDTKENVAGMASKWLPIARSIAGAVVFSCGVTRQWIYPEPDWVMCWFYGAGQARSAWGFNCWQPFLAYGKDPALATGNGCRPDAVNANTPANAGEIDHPCPKPVALWVWFINRLSFKLNALFYEPFCGSGTTIIACEQTGRRCYGMEMSQDYCDTIIRRWQDFTGQRAVRESDGMVFPA